MNEILEYSAVELGRKIRNQAITPPQVLEAYIDRVRLVNPKINALVVKLFETARQRAREQYQASRNSEELPLFHGVPVSIKEMISVEGQPITCGSVYREDARSTADADVVRNLKQAGAIPFGLTNVPELGLWIESSNPVYGTTHNPHDPDRTAGGSSGGEAALVAAEASPMGVGSDMGGSIRIPATFCGIYGHKPSTGRISVEGHFPHEHSPHGLDSVEQTDIVSLGPMTRHAKDLLPLFEILRSNHLTEEAIPEESSDLVDFSETTAYLLPDPAISMASSPSDDVSTAVERAGSILSDHGADVKPLPSDLFEKATQLYLTYLENEELPPVGQLAGNGESIGLTGELTRKLFSQSRHTLPLLTLCLVESVFSPSNDEVERALEAIGELRNELSQYLDPSNLIVMPTFPTRAPYHGRSILRPFDLMYAAIFNILDFPVTAAPISYNNSEAPVGVQVVSPMGRDTLGIGAAMAFEETLGTPRYQE